MEYRKPVNMGHLMYAIVELSRGHSESGAKSERISKAREAEREKARQKIIVTGRVPAWLRPIYSEHGIRLEVIPEAVQVIRTIFTLKLQGIGLRTIERKLNTEADWFPPKSKKRKTEGWRASYIRKILTYPAVMGVYQPYQRTTGRRTPVGEPIAGYYPEIIKPTTFRAVQAKMRGNRGKAGRIGKAKNLLRHLAVCGHCGGPMHIRDRGNPAKGGAYLYCDTGLRNCERNGIRCDRIGISYDECERLILDNCYQLRPEQVLPNPDEQASVCDTLSHRIAGKTAELAGIDGQIDNLVDLISRTADAPIRDRYEKRANELAGRKKVLASEIAADQNELSKSQASLKSFTVWKRNLATLRKQLATGDIEVRMRVQSHLRGLIDRIEVFPGGLSIVPEDFTFRVKKFVYFNKDFGIPVGEAEGFYAYIRSRYETSEGRCLRVHFKCHATPSAPGGTGVVLRPEPSLEGGGMLTHPDLDEFDCWDVTVPDWKKLWQDYQVRRLNDRAGLRS
jgi:hypothetical protein